MKILFVGTKMQGYFIEEECNKNNWHLDYVITADNMDLINYETDILAQSIRGYDYIVYDISSCITEAEVIAYTISQIEKSTNASPIVIVNTLNAKNVVVAALIDKNIRSFINKGSGTATDFKEQFVKNVSGYYDKNSRDVVTKIEKEIDRKIENVRNTKTIGVAGVCRRIGTTTQAIQIAKYINSKGYKSCVIESNNVKYPNTLNKHTNNSSEISYFEKNSLFLEGDIHDKELGYFRNEGVDIYYKPSKLNEIREKGYNYLVFDYGVYTANAFNKTAFLKDDEIVFVAGVDIAELDYLVDVLGISSYKDAKLIFSFANEKNVSEIEHLFKEINGNINRCFFTNYTPDPYILSNEKMYDEMFGIENKEEIVDNEPVKKKKFSIFGRKK